MRYGILSDIHGNLEALQTVLAFYRKEGINDLICLGDIVGYGANPKECIDLMRELKVVCIAGNHDWAVSGRLSYDMFHQSAKKAVIWTQGQLASEDAEFLNNLSLIFQNDYFVSVHGTLSEPERFNYLIYISDAMETFHLMDRDICFVGHSHVPQILKRKGEDIVCIEQMTAKIEPQDKYIVNVGSVGQPRDGNPMASCCVYEPDTHSVEIHRMSYDIPTAHEKILAAGLPATLAERLLVGM